MELSAADLRTMQQRDLENGHVANGIPAGMEDDFSDDFEEEDELYCNEPSPRAPAVELINYWTPKGTAIAFQMVPSDVLEKFDTFSVCESCGIVLWPVTFENLFYYD